jgi:hypothetical protein
MSRAVRRAETADAVAKQRRRRRADRPGPGSAARAACEAGRFKPVEKVLTDFVGPSLSSAGVMRDSRPASDPRRMRELIAA